MTFTSPKTTIVGAAADELQFSMTLYAAAGNEPTGTPVYPAGYDPVIAVGGLNPDGSHWKDSNYGSFVEHYEPAFANFNNRSYAGTSVASPYAAFKAARGASDQELFASHVVWLEMEQGRSCLFDQALLHVYFLIRDHQEAYYTPLWRNN
jgi:hypothetical protein